jgi:hypothetical protein
LPLDSGKCETSRSPITQSCSERKYSTNKKQGIRTWKCVKLRWLVESETTQILIGQRAKRINWVTEKANWRAASVNTKLPENC